MIYVIGHNDLVYTTSEDCVIDTTSRSKTFYKELSPFYLGPVELYNGHISKNLENAYQFCQVFARFLDESGDPSPEYFKWAKNGWNTSKPEKYPMGKGVRPVYFYWNSLKLSQIEARKEILIPLYSRVVKKTSAFKEILKLSKTDKDIYLLDFDGYNHKMLGMSYQDVIENEKKPMGHAFILSMLIDGFLE